jgi:glycine cleavage system H protein
MNTNANGMDLRIEDMTDESILLAVQGPKSSEVLDNFNYLKRFRFDLSKYGNDELMVARTGYTGEDGFELMLHNVSHQNPERGLKLYSDLVEKVNSKGGLEAGLGARDTLRLEAGLPLHGQDISEDITPVEAGMTRFVDTSKEYIGREAHILQQDDVKRRLVGLVAYDNCIPRPHQKVYLGTNEVGMVTSGTFSPVLKRGIAMAILQKEALDQSNAFEIEVGEKGAKLKYINFRSTTPKLMGSGERSLTDYDIPDGLLYTKEHEWAKIISEKEVVVGITSYAAEQLHDVVFVELPQPGNEVSQGKSACTVESVKSTSDVMSPFSGKVTKVNDELPTHPELVNKEPYNRGWFFVLEPSNLEREKANLMNASEYRKYLQSLSSK